MKGLSVQVLERRMILATVVILANLASTSPGQDPASSGKPKAALQPEGKVLPRKAAKHEETLAEWNLASAVPIEQFSFGKLAERRDQKNCELTPASHSVIEFQSLPPDEQADLCAAVDSLVSAINAGDPATMMNYMKSRGKIPSTSVAAMYRRFLERNNPAYKRDETVALDDTQVIADFWSYPAVKKSHWQHFVPDLTCFTIWMANKEDAQSLSELNAVSNPFLSAFEGQRSWTHSFSPSTGLDAGDVVSKETNVLVCDCLVLIEHDQELGGKRAPYLIRFWYDRATQHWQPISLSRRGKFEKEVLVNPMF